MARSPTRFLGKWTKYSLWVAVFYLVTGILDQFWFKQKFDVVDGFFVIAPLVLAIVLHTIRALYDGNHNDQTSAAPEDRPR